jgi:hypothetical protein
MKAILLVLVLGLASAAYSGVTLMNRPGDWWEPQYWDCLRKASPSVQLNAWVFTFVDDSFVLNVQSAMSAGFQNIEIYVLLSPAFPGVASISDMLAQLDFAIKSNNLNISAMWYLILAQDYMWNDSTLANADYLRDAINAATTSFSVPFSGVLSYAEGWDAVMDTNWDASFGKYGVQYFSSSPQKNFDDWPKNNFGQWAAPNRKIYDEVVLCNQDVYLAWNP